MIPAVLIVARILVLLACHSYIHPDGFFQSTEITASDIFGIKTLRPWEFDEANPCRSIVSAWLSSGWQYGIVHVLRTVFGGSVTPWEILYAPRIGMIILSIALDYAVWRLCTTNGMRSEHALGVLGVSWVTLVLQSRPFSNSIEAVLFATLLWLLMGRKHVGLCAGVIGVLGVFVRFTFVAFAVVPVYATCYRSWKAVMGAPIVHYPRVILGAAITAVMCVVIDSMYFGHLKWIPSVGFEGRLVFTPLNSLMYNLSSQNLATHGTHPRHTHALVNLSLMFGPTVLPLLAGGRSGVVGDVLVLKRIMWGTVVVSVGILSLACHQEARFLTPLGVPLAVLMGDRIRARPALWRLFILFNLVMVVVFGVLHQGGLTRSLINLGRHEPPGWCSSFGNATCTVVFAHTYMPPRSLLVDVGNEWHVIDLAGNVANEASLMADHPGAYLRISPGSVQVPAWCGKDSVVGRVVPHLSTENLPWGQEGFQKGRWDEQWGLVAHRCMPPSSHAHTDAYIE